jgi:hypothetical protein
MTIVPGARPLRRFIAREVETRIGRALIAGDVEDGATVRIDVVDGELVVAYETRRTHDLDRTSQVVALPLLNARRDPGPGRGGYGLGVTTTRRLLACGAIGAVLFVAVFLVNDWIKAGYDPVRDFVSEAAIGRGGWVQIANFLATGALMIAFSFGLRRAVSRWTAWLVRLFGIGLVAAGVFVSDPVPSDVWTWHGIVHDVVSLAVFASLSAACFTAARWRPSRRWRWYCVLTGIAVPVLFVATGGFPDTSGVFQRITVGIGWTWLAVLAMRAMRLTHPGVAGTPIRLGDSRSLGDAS